MRRDPLEEPYEDPRPSLWECQQPGNVISLNWKAWIDKSEAEPLEGGEKMTPAQRKQALKEKRRTEARLTRIWCDRSSECAPPNRCPHKMHPRQRRSLERGGHRMEELTWRRFDCFVEPSDKLTAYRAWKARRRRKDDDVRGDGSEA